MKKLFLAVPALAAVALAGCGGDSGCTSQGAELAAGNPIGTCSAAPNTIAFIPVQLCGKCTDTAPSCPGTTFRRDAIDNSYFVDINPVVQQCDENRGCGATGSCATPAPRVTCQVSVPADAPVGQPVAVVYEGTTVGAFTISGSNTCAVASASVGALEAAP